MGTVLRAARRQINISVSQDFYEKLEKLAKDTDETVATYAGLLLDAAYAAQTGAPKNATLDAHVALVGLSTKGGVSQEALAVGTGLPIAVIKRMQDAWKSVLRERRRGK